MIKMEAAIAKETGRITPLIGLMRPVLLRPRVEHYSRQDKGAG